MLGLDEMLTHWSLNIPDLLELFHYFYVVSVLELTNFSRTLSQFMLKFDQIRH